MSEKKESTNKTPEQKDEGMRTSRLLVFLAIAELAIGIVTKASTEIAIGLASIGLAKYSKASKSNKSLQLTQNRC